MIPRISGVLFDLDGTLVHSPIDFAAMKRAVRAIAADHGAPSLHASDVLGLVDEAADQVAAAAEFRAACEAAIVAIELDALRHATLFAGASETLAWLIARGVRVGIVTRNSRAVVDRLVTRLPLPAHVIVTRNEAPRPKPHPSHLLHALAHLAVTPADSVMIGDHAMDVTGGRAAGMRAIGIAHPQPGRRAQGAQNDNGAATFAGSDPDHIVTSFAELRSWLEPALRNP